MQSKYEKTPMGKWGLSMLAALFGLSAPTLGRYLNGMSYPTLQSIQKFEAVLGWPAAEQVQLIPPYWEWPRQNRASGKKPEEPTDYRYSMKLNQIIQEWAEANPRTVLSTEIRQHPNIPARAGTVKETPRPSLLHEFQARNKPLGRR
jgi:transcriptional regulator with XRE-family HTH domain